MGSGDLSADLAFGTLAPASAVRATQDHSQPVANPDAQPKARRRPPRREDDFDELIFASEADRTASAPDRRHSLNLERTSGGETWD